jgi:hypothetical protein
MEWNTFMNPQYLPPCYEIDYIHCCCHIARIDILVIFKEELSFQSHRCPLFDILLKLMA